MSDLVGNPEDRFSHTDEAQIVSSGVSLQNLNLNNLLVERKNDNLSPGDVTRGNKSLALTGEVNFDAQSTDTS